MAYVRQIKPEEPQQVQDKSSPFIVAAAGGTPDTYETGGTADPNA